jgi:nicotinate dehydrogenase subunit B
MTELLTESKIDELLEGSFDRQQFIKGSGALVIGFSLAGSLLANKASGATKRVVAGPPDANAIDSWIVVHENNTVTMYMGKIDITGTPSGLLQVAAEELDMTYDQLTAARVDTHLSPNQGGTFGSNGISSGTAGVRQAAAEARAVLLGLAAKQFGVPVSQLTVAKGVVSVKGDASKSVTYGALLGGKRFAAPNTGKAPQKHYSEYKVIGKAHPRKDTAEKVAGTYAYVHNLRLPGMLHGRVVRPLGQGPYAAPVRPLKVDPNSIKKIKGARIVRKGDFLGVVATTEQDAIQAATQLKVTWAQSATMPGNGNLWDAFRKVTDAERVAVNVGKIDAGLKQAVQVREASYAVAYQSHASFGPSAGVADVKADSALVMMAGQSVYGTRSTIAGLLDMDQEQVRIQFFEGAGCYGRNLQDDAAQAAAVMSQLVGKPVRVQLTRDQEHGWDFYGPATLVDIRGGVDANGKITAFDYVSFQQGWNGVETTAETLGTPIPTNAFGGADAPNSGAPYALPNRRVIGKNIPVGSGFPKVAYLRAPAAPQACFASEQMMDELAFAAGLDAVEFRNKNITNPRWLGVIAAAAKAAKWKTRKSASNVSKERVVTGRGIAIGGFANTHVAVVAEITVDKVTGKIRAQHLTAAHDCGRVVNPNTVHQQIEGCLIQGASRALIEEVKFSKSRVTSLDWESYPILRYKDAPELTVVLVDHPELASTGAGEPATAPVAAAIANAFFDATGKRVRQMPMTPGRVRSALKA